jgi:signal transduction histidine kinase
MSAVVGASIAAPVALHLGFDMSQRIPSSSPSLRAIAVMALLLVLTTLALFPTWGRGTVLVPLPWFNAIMLTFQALTCLTASVLLLGRYRVLQDPASYWVGIGFITYPIILVFYVLSWPGLLPDGGAVLGQLPGTAAWFPTLMALVLSACLYAAATARWPSPATLAGKRFAASVVIAMLGSALASALVIGFEHRLPTLVRADGSFTPLLDASNLGVAAVYACGTAVSLRAAQRSGDRLFALVAIFQLAATFVHLWIVLGSTRYDLWWYLARVVLTLGASGLLLGLLHEYVTLLRRERDQTRTLSSAESMMREQYERLQKAHEELQEADLRKNEFIAMLSHELRNPLSTISNALQVLKADGANEAIRSRAHDAALRQSSHMARLLDDLLDVSRITRGRISLQRERIDLVRVAQDAIDAVGPQIEALDHTLTTSLPASLMVHGDPVRLTQAITNLLHNAAKYTPPRGRIHLSIAAADKHVQVTVRDNGIGIARDVLPRVFELFVQADHSLDRQHGGLGVGLTVTRALVDLHGGTVEACSKGIGEGSEFTLRLPLEGQTLHSIDAERVGS